MEDNKSNSISSILLGNTDTPINISLLSTPKALTVTPILLSITKTLPLMTFT